MSEMKRTRLVQRLRAPHRGDGPLADLTGAFAFGGGLANGGLSGQAMSLLRDVFAFDYMGAAEFEFGAVPEALSALAGAHKSLVVASVEIPLREVAANWREPKGYEPEGFGTVYLLCRDSHLPHVKVRVRQMARRELPLKEWTNLDSTLRPTASYDGDTVGWLELDNGFMFFTDREMWSKSAALFGVAVPDREVTA